MAMRRRVAGQCRVGAARASLRFDGPSSVAPIPLWLATLQLRVGSLPRALALGEIRGTTWGRTTGSRFYNIPGAGRSGSTLLDRLLGQVNGFYSIGELKWIWRLV